MNFITFDFFIFLIIFIPTFLAFPIKYKKYILLVGNMFFIGFYKIEFVYWNIIISFIIFYGTLKIKNKNSKIILISTLTFIIGIWVYLKFFSHIIRRMGILNPLILKVSTNILVPIGISFYILQGISYIIDVYRNKYEPEKNFINFLVYMSFFPIFLQGPISRYEQLLPQLLNPKRFNYDKFVFGIQLSLWGIFKKLVISNRLSLISASIFDNHQKYTGVVILISGMVYALELYTDFSAAVDITRGISQSMGIDIIKNFNYPNSATSIKDFWSRWHISLSTWLRDYIYIPLGGNRKGKLRKYINIFIVFLISGIWHGVGLKFIAWALLHGIYQVFSDTTLSIKEYIKEKLSYRKILTLLFDNKNIELFISKIFTFVFVSFAWIFFRAGSLKAALSMVKSIKIKFLPSLNELVNNFPLDSKDTKVLIGSLIILYIIERINKKTDIRESIAEKKIYFRWSLFIIFINIIIVMGIYGPGYNASEFIYMGF